MISNQESVRLETKSWVVMRFSLQIGFPVDSISGNAIQEVLR